VKVPASQRQRSGGEFGTDVDQPPGQVDGLVPLWVDVKLGLPTVSQMPGSLVPGRRGKTQGPVPEKSKLPSVPYRASQ